MTVYADLFLRSDDRVDIVAGTKYPPALIIGGVSIHVDGPDDARRVMDETVRWCMQVAEFDAAKRAGSGEGPAPLTLASCPDAHTNTPSVPELIRDGDPT